MFSTLRSFLASDAWWGDLTRITLAFMVAWLIHRLAWRIAGVVVSSGLFAHYQGGRMWSQRQETLQGLFGGIINFLGLAGVILYSMGQFVTVETLLWVTGLFSLAFGFAAHLLMADLFTGVTFVLNDTFGVGEKIETAGVQGVVEHVNLRTTLVRSPTGELYVVPNGEMRTIRNFSRGRFSPADITLKIEAADLPHVLPLLEALGQEAAGAFPDLLERWHVISPSGLIGRHTELTLVIKARFGRAASLRPRLLALVHARLAAAGVTLVG